MRRLDEIPLKENDRLAVEQAARILREQFDVEQVILFGSKARGDDRADSDIDLLVLTKGPVSDAEKQGMTDAVFDLQLDLNVLISKLVVAANDWENGLYRVLPIKRIIEREGAAA